MAGEASETKIKNALSAWLTGHIGADLEIDRPYDRSFGDDDLATSKVNIRIPTVDYERAHIQNGLRNIATVAFDITARSPATGSIDAVQAEIKASILARIMAKTPTPGTLGYLIDDTLFPLGALAEQENLADHGGMTFAYRIAWLTPVNDIRTIIAIDGTPVP